MKGVVACIFAIALMLRAAPICAAPVQTEAAVMMVDCEGVPNNHDGQAGQKGDDAARSCHACDFRPAAIAGFTQPAPTVVILSLTTSVQLAGGALQPPTPPPRKVVHTTFST